MKYDKAFKLTYNPEYYKIGVLLKQNNKDIQLIYSVKKDGTDEKLEMYSYRNYMVGGDYYRSAEFLPEEVPDHFKESYYGLKLCIINWDLLEDVQDWYSD